MSPPFFEGERVFFALWPTPELAARMRVIADQLAIPGRRLPAANLHITLAFVGDVATHRLPELEAVGNRLLQPGFTLDLDRVGQWRRPKITWFGPSQVPSAAQELYAALQAALGASGFPTSQRVFKPHVTLARKSPPVKPTNVAPLRWPVARLALVSSERRRHGSQYRIRGEWPLAEHPCAGV